MIKTKHLVLGLFALLAIACGPANDGNNPNAINAVNLTTGERKSFGSPGDVPPGWSPCSDPACTNPFPPIPCSKLGAKVCELSPRCERKAINCMGSGCVEPTPSGTPTDPPTKPTCPPQPPPTCEYICVAKQPHPCSDISDEKKCSANARCEWGQGPCPMSACQQGAPCPPCPFNCRDKAAPPPPPPPPPPCPALPSPAPDFCPNGRIVAKIGPNNCVVGYTCEPKCLPMPMAYPQCPDGQLPQPKYNSDGCLVGFECVGTSPCDALTKQYASALANAKVCQHSQMGPVAQCDVTVPSALACACNTYVAGANASAIAELKKLKATWDTSGCGANLACPAIACMAPKGATCSSTSSPSNATPVGVCQDNLPTQP